MTQHYGIRHNDTQHKGLICDTQHNNAIALDYAECHYAERCILFLVNAEYLHADCRGDHGVCFDLVLISFNGIVQFC